MADKKISDFTSLSVIAAGDLMEVETAAGNSRKVLAEKAGLANATSMPGSPASGDRVWRSDLGLEFYYDGTRWLTATLFTVSADSIAAVTVTTGTYVALPYFGVYSIYVEAFSAFGFRSAAGEWDILLQERQGDGTLTTIATLDGSGDTTNVWTAKHAAVGAVTAASARLWLVTATEISGSAAFTANALIHYRLIGT